MKTIKIQGQDILKHPLISTETKFDWAVFQEKVKQLMAEYGLTMLTAEVTDSQLEDLVGN